MSTAKTRLPRVSTLAYKELRRNIPANELAENAECKTQEDDQQLPEAEIGADDANKAILAALDGVENHPIASELSSVSLSPEKADNLSNIISNLKSNTITPIQALSKVRHLCAESIYQAQETNNSTSATAINTFLDNLNSSLAPHSKIINPIPSKHKATTTTNATTTNDNSTQEEEQPPLPPPIIPEETFFLPPSSLGDTLTITVESDLLRSQSSQQREHDADTTTTKRRRTIRPPQPPGSTSTQAPPSSSSGRGGRGKGRGKGKGRGTAATRQVQDVPVWTVELQKCLYDAMVDVLTPVPTEDESGGGSGVPAMNATDTTTTTTTTNTTTNNNNTVAKKTAAAKKSKLSDQPSQPTTDATTSQQQQPQQGDGNDTTNNNETTTTTQPPTLSIPKQVGIFIQEVKNSGVCEVMHKFDAKLPITLSQLQSANFLTAEAFLSSLEHEVLDTAEAFLSQHKPESRRGKTTGAVERFVNVVSSLLSDMMAEILHLSKLTRYQQMVAQGMSEEALAEQRARDEAEAFKRLPPSIIYRAQTEPFRHGEWRKKPFVPRPYVRLSEYYIVEEDSREAIQRKLTTGKKGGCDGQHCQERESLGTYSLEHEGFQSACSCLSDNTECDATCGCEKDGNCLNRAVTRRQTVVLNEDVEEINSWGMDCCTRKIIQDAVLESGAFGEYTMPNFKAMVSKMKADGGAKVQQRGAATAAGQQAAVAADVQEAQLTADLNSNGENGNGGGDSLMSGDARGRRPASAASRPGSSKSVASARPGTASGTTAEDAKRRAAAIEHAVVNWIERTLIPAINRQGNDGWNIVAALDDIKAKATPANDQASLTAVCAIEKRLQEIGDSYFRVHPKGVGLVCRRQGGLPRLTFVEEYLGEIYTPWRWFELQDAVKRITGDELPDFYNIVLERPKNDPAGYDVLFIDAAAKGAFASRMSHSCTPNCQAVVMACGGRLTIALYTLRHVQEGEELTFDYSSVTESEKEYREAICLCGTHMCRGSYLYYSGSKAFMQVLSQKHNMLHRQINILRAGIEPFTDEDRERLRRHGLGESCLGSVERGDRVPGWLEKWTSLICEYLDIEEQCLRKDLLENDPLHSYTEASAAAEAKGVVANRLQNIVITLDKVRTFLAQPNQPQGPPLFLLNDAEVMSHLWTGEKSIVKRLLRGAAHLMLPSGTIRGLNLAGSEDEYCRILKERKSDLPENLARLVDAILVQPRDVADVKQRLLDLVTLFREIDMAIGGGLTAAADVTLMYARTTKWFTYERAYKSYSSPPVPINLQDLFLNREETHEASIDVVGGSGGDGGDDSTSALAIAMAEEKAKRAENAAAALARQHANNPALRKIYRPTYCWGQLSGWFKQTVNDPTASLSAERRGTLSLPDIESCFVQGRYGAKERAEMIRHLSTRPDGMWKTGTQWTFKNEAKVYGSPAFDAGWVSMVGSERAGMEDPLPIVLRELDEAVLPFSKAYAAKGRVRGGGGGGGSKSNTSMSGGGDGGGGVKRKGRKRSKKDDDDFFDDDDLTGIDFSMM